MMRFIAAVLTAQLFQCALASPISAKNLTFEPKEIKFDGSADSSRVVGGFTASEGQFPYIASLRRTSSSIHFCGASIVSARYLLSAAHCTNDVSPASVTAMVGTNTLNSGGKGYVLSNIFNHPNFIWSTAENDISLLRTASPIGGSNVIASIPIGSSYVGGGVTVTLSGWGFTSIPGSTPNDLQWINLRTINNTVCDQSKSPNFPLHTSNICTFTLAGEGACNGDSGGPLVANGILVGIVSWGEPCAVGYPDVFTRVSSHVDWIQENAT